MRTPYAWLSRLAAIALLLALPTFAYFAVVQPAVRAYRQNETALSEVRDLLGRMEDAATTQGELQRSLQEIAEREAMHSYYLTKETDALAAAELQDLAQATIGQNGGTIRSIQTLPGESEGEFRRVALRIHLVTTTPALFRITPSGETGQPLLFLDNVDVQSRSVRQTAEQQPREPMLIVILDLYGYRPAETL